MKLQISKLAAQHGLADVSFELVAGDRLALFGPTGSGKSTLLRLIVGLETPTRGDILLNGKRINDVPPHLRGIAFLPQRPALYPHLTVLENLQVAVPRDKETRGHGDKGNKHSLCPVPLVPLSKPEEAAELLKITPLLPRLPGDLSGGEKQRVALAKAVLRQAPLWLLDEPFAPLDPVFRAEFRRELALLLDSTGATMILVSHDPIDALALGRRVGVLGDGRLQQLGTPEELQARPGSPFVAAIAGQFSFPLSPLGGEGLGVRGGRLADNA